MITFAGWSWLGPASISLTGATGAADDDTASRAGIFNAGTNVVIISLYGAVQLTVRMATAQWS